MLVLRKRRANVAEPRSPAGVRAGPTRCELSRPAPRALEVAQRLDKDCGPLDRLADRPDPARRWRSSSSWRPTRAKQGLDLEHALCAWVESSNRRQTMETRTLGGGRARHVDDVGLGTMTFGVETGQGPLTFERLDRFVQQAVATFVDTARRLRRRRVRADRRALARRPEHHDRIVLSTKGTTRQRRMVRPALHSNDIDAAASGQPAATRRRCRGCSISCTAGTRTRPSTRRWDVLTGLISCRADRTHQVVERDPVSSSSSS